LLVRVTRTELSERYAGSLLGLGWLVATPALFLGVYAAVYLYIFDLRGPGLARSEYLLYIVTGLVPYLATAEAVSLGVTSVVASRAVLSNVVFPIDLVPPKAVLSAQPTMVVGSTMLAVAAVALHSVTWVVVLAPLIWILQVLALIGLGWILALLNVILRDLTHAVSVILLLILVASPIAYTPDMVTGRLKLLVALNPLAYFIVAYQRIVVLGKLPTLGQTVGIVVISLGLFGLGGWFFARAKPALIDYV
jgi:lipopolysaccharide transport system permease protein